MASNSWNNIFHADFKRMRLHGFIISIQVYKETREKDEKPYPRFAIHIMNQGGQQLLLMRGPSCSNVYFISKSPVFSNFRIQNLHKLRSKYTRVHIKFFPFTTRIQ
jgi:hypothetical protein